MVLHAAFRQLLLPGVLRPESRYTGGFRDWLVDGNWATNSNVTRKKAEISLHDGTELVDALVNDSIRLATVAFECAIAFSQRRGEPQACAWQIISYYYSAYFAANSIMRLSGVFCTNLDADACSEVNERAALYGHGGTTDASKIQVGNYFCSIQSGGTQHLKIQSLSGVKGGVHIQFWNGFIRFLDAADGDVAGAPLTTADLKTAKSQIADLKAALSFGGCANGSWLSEMRNAVNYRFEQEAWFPYGAAGSEVSALRASLRKCVAGQLYLPAGTLAISEVDRLARVSGFLLGWAKDAMEVMVATSKRGKKRALSDGALNFASQLQ